jgi:broad specificity phosphatase PhoE
VEFDTFLYLRHGQSEANLQGIMCGRRCDSPLTELGRQQARLAAEILKRTAVIGSICVSPQHRAQETAQIVNALLSVPVVTIEELAEWDVGSWDHQPYTTVREDFLSSANPPGGETRPELVQRVRVALGRCVDARPPALLVSHGGVWLAVQQVLGLEPSRSENAVPYKLERENNGWSVDRLV